MEDTPCEDSLLSISTSYPTNYTAFPPPSFKALGTINTPAHRAVDDASPLGRTKEVLASFGLH
ncbi:hypothetical protein DOS86_04980 [Anaplasma marginale]|nr:hypothetical protein DOS86_04980 [Anaplasma marginale]